jgi:hypothetical protein
VEDSLFWGERLNDLSSSLAQITTNVKSFGAKGDGIADDTIVIQNAVNSLKNGDRLFFPNGQYLTTDTIQIPKPITLEMQGHILAKHDKTGLLVKDSSSLGSFHPNYHNRHKLNLRINVKRVKGYELNPAAIGVELVNIFSGNIYLEELDNNYIGAKYRGVPYGTGYAGMTYTETKIGVIRSIKTNILLSAEGTTGWVTQNQFYGGSLTYETAYEGEQVSVDLSNVGSSVINENTFFGVSFEGAQVAIKGIKAQNNKFISCRFEMPNALKLFDFDSMSSYNEITNSNYVAEHMRQNKFADLSSQTTVTYSDYKLGKIMYFDGVFHITPNRNRVGRPNAVVNHPVLADIPTDWNVRILTDGLSKVTYYSDTNINGTTVTIPINRGNEMFVYERSTHPYSILSFSKPPENSMEFVVSYDGAITPTTLAIDGTINLLVDKTGQNKAVPVGTNFTKLFYDYKRNNIYILNHY